MAEFASKGMAGTALGLGVAGTVGLVNQLGNGGLLGGLFGGNNNAAQGVALGVISEKDSEIARLKAENYSDKVSKEVYAQSLADNKTLRDEMYAFIKPLADESANNRVNMARVEEQLAAQKRESELREQIMLGKVNEVALVANNGITALNGALACLQQTVSGITKIIVPSAAVCPQPMPAHNAWVAPNNCGCSCNNG